MLVPCLAPLFRRPCARSLALALATLAAALWPGAALWAQTSRSSGIYTCVDERGRRLTADRPIAECAGREQHVLNHDGSIKAVLPPSLTAEERAAREKRERRAAEARTAQADTVRRDRNLVSRYPDEASHQRAREASLDTVRLAIKASDLRLRELAAERKPLLSEAEFYVGRTLPPKLRTQLDANDAAVGALRSSAINQEAELERISRIYDVEIERLRRLWAGAPAGSLGPLNPLHSVAGSAAAEAASRPTTPP